MTPPATSTPRLPPAISSLHALFSANQWALSDVTFYFLWSGFVAEGEVPYRDFFFDYPPLSLPVLVLPRVVTGLAELTYGTYLVLFSTTMALLGLGLTGVVRRVVADLREFVDRDALVRHVIVMALALPVLLIRYDLWPILLTALAFLAAIKGRSTATGILLGIAIAAKLYPAVLLPIFAAYWWVSGERRDAIVVVATAALAVVIAIVPFALVADGGILETLRFQQERGLQIETLAGGVIQLLSLGSESQLEVVHTGTFELVSNGVASYLTVQPIIAVSVVGVAVVIGGYRLRQAAGTATAPHVLAAVSIAVILAFVLTNRVLSPQHVFWILPFTALLAGYRYFILLAVLGLTLMIFPLLYDRLLLQDAAVILLLNARNALLLGLAVVLLFLPVAVAKGTDADQPAGTAP
jgi:uncharacterized membrane protein